MNGRGRRAFAPGGLSRNELTGKRVRVGGEVAQVLHVDLLRVVLMTEAQDGVAPHRVVVSQDDGIDVGVIEERRED